MRPTGSFVTDPDTDEQVPEWATVHTDLPGRLDAGHGHSGRTRSQDVAGQTFEQPIPEWHVPWGTTDILPGDHIDVTTGDTAPIVLRVLSVPRGDQQTALRLPVEVVDRPSEWGA
jgi:hypothetical protein